MKLTYNTSALEVTCNVLQKRIFIRITGPFTSDDFKKALLQALAYAKTNSIKHWLLDFRAIGKLGEEEEAWVFSEFFPQLMITLGANNFIAMLLSEKCYEYLLSEVGKLGLMSSNTFVIFNNFFEEQEALKWLDENMSETVKS